MGVLGHCIHLLVFVFEGGGEVMILLTHRTKRIPKAMRPEELMAEYGYEVNKWYDAKKHDRPKVSNLLVCRTKPFYAPFAICYPNANSLHDKATNATFPYDDIVAWMVPFCSDDFLESLA